MAGEHMHKQIAVCALYQGQMLPGTFIPLPALGKEENYSCIC